MLKKSEDSDKIRMDGRSGSVERYFVINKYRRVKENVWHCLIENPITCNHHFKKIRIWGLGPLNFFNAYLSEPKSLFFLAIPLETLCIHCSIVKFAPFNLPWHRIYKLFPNTLPLKSSTVDSIFLICRPSSQQRCHQGYLQTKHQG